MELAGVVQAAARAHRLHDIQQLFVPTGNLEPDFWSQRTVTPPLPPLNIGSANVTSVRGLLSGAITGGIWGRWMVSGFGDVTVAATRSGPARARISAASQGKPHPSISLLH
jgi:hypothetical protein